MAIRTESGITLEEDNRVEPMYHWGAMVLDLCGLPVEEYMKPMPVNVVSGGTGGGGGDDSGATYNLIYKVSGSTYATQQYRYGETITAPSDPEVPEGYVFRGWDGLPSTMPKRSVTVNAIIEEVSPEPSGASEYTFYFIWMLNNDLDSPSASTKIQQAIANSGESVTATTELATGILLTIPGDPAWNDIEDDEQEEEWIATHGFSLVVAIPNEATLLAVRQGTEANANMVGTELEKNRGAAQIDNKPYKVTSYCKEGTLAYTIKANNPPMTFYITLE